MAEVAALLHTRRGIAKGLRNDMARINGLIQTLGTVLVNSVEFNQVPATIRESGGRVELGRSCRLADASLKTSSASSHLPSGTAQPTEQTEQTEPITAPPGVSTTGLPPHRLQADGHMTFALLPYQSRLRQQLPMTKGLP